MREGLILAVKVAVSAAVIYAIGQRVELGEMMRSVHDAHAGHLVIATLLAVLAVPAVSVRWRLLGKMFAIRLPVGLATRATFAGLFVGQVLPGAIGADVVRGWMVWHEGLRNKLVIASLVADRVVSLAAIGLMILVALPFLAPHLPAALADLTRMAFMVGMCLLLAGVAAGAYLRHHTSRHVPQRWLERLRAAGVRPTTRAIVAALGLAIVGHALVILSAYFLSLAMQVESELWMWWLVMPIVTLVTAIPISINGWGVRELAMVQLWALFGVQRSDAFLISICMGLVAIVSSLPGLWFWLLKKRSLQTSATTS